AGTVAAGLALVLLWWVGAPPLDPRPAPPADSSPVGAASFPRRIGPYVVPPRDLPQQSGPLAGIFEGTDAWLMGAGRDVPSRAWFALAPNGHVWRLPHVDGPMGTFPALSEDGRLLGFGGQDGCYRVRNLVTGVDHSYPGLPCPGGMGGQIPFHFSPSGNLLLAPYEQDVWWVLRPDGSSSALPITDTQNVVGWLDDTHVLMTLLDLTSDSPWSRVQFVTIDPVTGSRREQVMNLSELVGPFEDSGQWTGRFNADRTVLYLQGGGTVGPGVVRLEVATDGRLSFAPRRTDLPVDRIISDTSPGALQVVGENPATFTERSELIWLTASSDRGGGIEWSESDQHSVLQFHPAWSASWIWLATRPLAGTAQGLATPDSWWGWWWPHLLVVACVSAPAFWWWMRRRALRPQVTIRSEGPAA
ncbi:MAG: hypothetical protein WBP28_07075, partial [Nostocoides sp.]